MSMIFFLCFQFKKKIIFYFNLLILIILKTNCFSGFDQSEFNMKYTGSYRLK